MNNLTVTKHERYWACMLYLVCVFAGVMPGLLMATVSIAFKMINKTEYVEKAILRPVVVLMMFYTLDKVVVLIPTILSIFNNIISVYDLQQAQGLLGNLANTLMAIFDVIQIVFIIMIVLSAAMNREVAFPFVDGIVNKIYNAVNEKLKASSEEDICREEKEHDDLVELED